ncbi:MAG: GTP cyclohydrolase I FolE [Chlamydiales bacterium]
MDEYSMRTLKSNSIVATGEFEDYIRRIILFIGDDPDGEHCADTPKRVVKSWKELFSGYSKNPVDALGTVFSADGYDQMVILKDIEIYSTCSHHMIPFYGKAHIAYIPGKKVVGLSKLARLAEVFARRLQVQERLTQQIADTLMKVLKPKGVMVVIEAKHMCMCARGISKQNSSMITSSIHGVFKDSSVRSEFLELIK